MGGPWPPTACPSAPGPFLAVLPTALAPLHFPEAVEPKLRGISRPCGRRLWLHVDVAGYVATWQPLFLVPPFPAQAPRPQDPGPFVPPAPAGTFRSWTRFLPGAWSPFACSGRAQAWILVWRPGGGRGQSSTKQTASPGFRAGGRPPTVCRPSLALPLFLWVNFYRNTSPLTCVCVS